MQPKIKRPALPVKAKDLDVTFTSGGDLCVYFKSQNSQGFIHIFRLTKPQGGVWDSQPDALTKYHGPVPAKTDIAVAHCGEYRAYFTNYDPELKQHDLVGITYDPTSYSWGHTVLATDTDPNHTNLGLDAAVSNGILHIAWGASLVVVDGSPVVYPDNSISASAFRSSVIGNERWVLDNGGLLKYAGVHVHDTGFQDMSMISRGTANVDSVYYTRASGATITKYWYDATVGGIVSASSMTLADLEHFSVACSATNLYFVLGGQIYSLPHSNITKNPIMFFDPGRHEAPSIESTTQLLVATFNSEDHFIYLHNEPTIEGYSLVHAEPMGGEWNIHHLDVSVFHYSTM